MIRPATEGRSLRFAEREHSRSGNAGTYPRERREGSSVAVPFFSTETPPAFACGYGAAGRRFAPRDDTESVSPSSVVIPSTARDRGRGSGAVEAEHGRQRSEPPTSLLPAGEGARRSSRGSGGGRMREPSRGGTRRLVSSKNQGDDILDAEGFAIRAARASRNGRYPSWSSRSPVGLRSGRGFTRAAEAHRGKSPRRISSTVVRLPNEKPRSGRRISAECADRRARQCASHRGEEVRDAGGRTGRAQQARDGRPTV